MSNSLTVTEAARGFADLINRVRYHHESTVLLKGGKAVAKIIPVGSGARTGAELADLWPSLPHLPPAEADAFARTVAAARKALPSLKDPWA